MLEPTILLNLTLSSDIDSLYPSKLCLCTHYTCPYAHQKTMFHSILTVRNNGSAWKSWIITRKWGMSFTISRTCTLINHCKEVEKKYNSWISKGCLSDSKQCIQCLENMPTSHWDGIPTPCWMSSNTHTSTHLSFTTEHVCVFMWQGRIVSL